MKRLLLILLLTIPFIGFGQIEYKKTYHENGQLKYETNWKDDKEEGLEKLYYESGRIYSEGNYKDGELISKKCWDKNGQEIDCE